MQLLFLVLGLLLVTVVYNSKKKLGAVLIIVLILGAWLTAKKRGIL